MHIPISVSKYRPYLTSYIKGRTDYINAVCVPVFYWSTYRFVSFPSLQYIIIFHCLIVSFQSFTEPSAFILTQYPLKDTEVDLWRLCMDHNVHALVVLGENSQVLYSFELLKEYNCFVCTNNRYILVGSRIFLTVYDA